MHDTTTRSAARVAGTGYLSIFFLAILSEFVVRQRLVVPADPVATAANVAGSAGLVRVGIAGYAVIFLLDVAIAWGLYVMFRPAAAQRSLLAAWFRLAYTVFLGVAAVFMFLALQLATGAGYAGMAAAQRNTWLMLTLDAFDYTWLVGLAAFGVHLVLVGRIMVTTGTGPRWLGWVLSVAGAAYVLDTLAHTLLSTYADHADLFLVLVAVPSVVGELAFTVWLLARAGHSGQPVGERRGQPDRRGPDRSVRQVQHLAAQYPAVVGVQDDDALHR